MASIALRFYNFPPAFGKVDVREFLHLFGLEADSLGTRRGSVCAVVLLSTEAEVRLVISRLHQLLLGKYRLKVEYCDGKKKAKVDDGKNEATVGSEAAAKRQKAIESVLQRGAMQTFEGFPPSSILYQYPKISPATVDNIARELTSNKAFYYQVLHLMNKMNLRPPFAVQDEARNPNSEPQESSSLLPQSDEESELESELESDTENTGPTTKKVKLNSSLPLPKTMKVMNYAPDTQPAVPPNVPKTSKLKIHISGNFLNTAENESEPAAEATEPASERESVPASVEDILSNRIPEEQRASLNVFQNYAAGDPSGKLYIKNLAKQVTEQDLMEIYQLFHDKAAIQAIDVKLMKTGRMKGQAFVSFLPVDEDSPSEAKQFAKCIATALSTTNGYILKNKPMVVSYAKNTKS